MSFRRILSALALITLTGLIFSPPALAQIKTIVSIPPQAFFLEKVGGESVHVTTMLPPGADAHTYEPRPRQMVALAKAQAYFTVGVEFESVWLNRFKAANSKMLVVRTEAKVPRVAVDGDDHHSGRPDPHIWLSPKLAAIQARAMRNGLTEMDPANQAVFDQNLATFQAELDRLDQDLRRIFGNSPGKKRILVLHPSWGYLCQEYGLIQVAVEKEGRKPTARGLKELIGQARKQGAKVVFVQPQFSDKAAQTLAQAIGGRVVRLDPLAGDWATNLREVVMLMARGLY